MERDPAESVFCAKLYQARGRFIEPKNAIGGTVDLSAVWNGSHGLGLRKLLSAA